MAERLGYLEAKKFCVVFVQVADAASDRVRLQCFRGRASIDRGQLNVIDANGTVFPVPNSALGNILPSDGTALLQDAEYFALVKTDDKLDFISTN